MAFETEAISRRSCGRMGFLTGLAVAQERL